MIKRLQDISFRVSRYFRPLEPWHCGGTEDGSQCLLGPDKNGNCRAIKDCTPAQEGKTWMCKRSELLGGACQAGPSAHGACGRQHPPCQPVRNIRSQRSRFVWLFAAGALAFTGLMLALDNWQQPLNPGTLSKHHAAFGEENCSACHNAVTAPRASWIKRAFADVDGEHAKLNDATRCVSCHELGPQTQMTHSLAPETLEGLSEAAELRAEESVGVRSFAVSLAKNFVGQDAPACSTCHSEHMGTSADITKVSNQQCAVCHTNSFDDFAGHIQFANYPADARTPIIFSHNTHLNKHFAEEDLVDLAPGACLDCHTADAVGRKMEVRGFSETCADCHLSQITGESRAGDKGFAMMSIPALDVDTLSERGVEIGSWPEYSDAEFTPLNALLVVATNPALTERMADFRKLDLYDLTDASEAELKLVYDVVWTLKRVYFEMRRGGARVVSERLASVLPADSVTRDEIFGLLSPAVIEQALAEVFPELDDEVSTWLQSGAPEFSYSAPVAEEPAPEPVESTAEASSGGDDDWLSGALADDDGGDDDWLSGALDDESVDEEAAAEDDDWLSGALDDEGAEEGLDEGSGEASDESLDDWLSEAAADDEDVAEDSAADDWLAGALDDEGGDDEDWLDGALDDSSSAFEDDDLEAETLDDEETASAVVELIEELSKEDKAAAGGWYYENYYFRYRPAGHADQLIVAWIERITQSSASLDIGNSELAQMQRALLGDSTPGSCLKCHSVDEVEIAGASVSKVNWLGKRVAPTTHDFNAFRHQSHFSVVSEVNQGDVGADLSMAGCQSCHVINPESDSAIAYEADANGAFESDFHDLKIDQCADCHQAEPALSSCTQCHSYHIGERKLAGIEDRFKQAVTQAETE